MADMIVANAEYSAANGTYTEGGTDTGKPFYIHESNSNYLIRWDGNLIWIIGDSVDYMFLYGCGEDVATPDLCSGWLDLLASEPSALTVTYTAGSTGALRRTNMNAQMSNLTGGMHG